MTPPVIRGWEHKTVFCDVGGGDYQKWLHAQKYRLTGKEKEILGLYEKKNGYAPGNFIGMVWIGGGKSRAVLQVDSKFVEMDYIKMFAECAAHPEIGGRIGGCLHFWPEEELIDAPDDVDFLILTALAYLRELNELCRHRLRRHFLRETQNFCGKVKGKILIGENLRQNIVRARPDRIVCEYQAVGDDILENRILRAALERVARLLSHSEHLRRIEESPVLQQWIRSSRAALHGVSVSQIKRRDFSAARNRGAFTFYRRPLALAKAVLLQLGFNPHEDIPAKTQTPPFALNSEKLFERYAELHLRRQYDNIPDYEVRTPGDISGGVAGINIKVRPDFYIARNTDLPPQIIDAKYKRAEHYDNADFYQIVAYSRHCGVQQSIGGADGVELSLAYPYFKNSDSFVWREGKTGSFLPNVHIRKIPCPTK